MCKGLFYRVMLASCLAFTCAKTYSQSKTIIKDTVIEEIVYEYDTIYVDDIKLNIDTIYNFLKPKFPLLPTLITPKLTAMKSLNIPFCLAQDTLRIFYSFGLSAFTIVNHIPESNPSKTLTVSSGQNIFPTMYFGAGIIKNKMTYGINLEYRQYSEVLKQSIPENWQDTLDNGNEIYYQEIDGQLSSIIKNQYRFIDFNTSVGYNMKKNNFSFSPSVLIGSGISLEQKNFELDTVAKKIVEIKNADKAGSFLSLGVALQINYSIKNKIDLYIKPEWQHFFIATNSHPLSYRDIFGLSFGVAYTFNTIF